MSSTKKIEPPSAGERFGCCANAGDAEHQVALAFKALGHPVRLRILRSLADRTCCCGELCAELPLAQSTVSQHLELLRKVGLVVFRQDGTRSAYSLDRSRLAALTGDLRALFGTDAFSEDEKAAP